MIEFNKIEEIEKYYNQELNTYVFQDGETHLSVKFNFDLKINANIDARNIDARNIDAWDIHAGNIDARNIHAGNIDALDIDAWDIDAGDINYYAVCIARKSFKCYSIKGRRENSIHLCLDNPIENKSTGDKNE